MSFPVSKGQLSCHVHLPPFIIVGMDYPSHLYATLPTFMLHLSPLCYPSHLYATPLTFMLPFPSLCYTSHLYTTPPTFMLHLPSLCYPSHLYAKRCTVRRLMLSWVQTYVVAKDFLSVGFKNI